MISDLKYSLIMIENTDFCLQELQLQKANFQQYAYRDEQAKTSQGSRR